MTLRDSLGKPVRLGSRVTIECVVIRVSPLEKKCNCLLEVAEETAPGYKAQFNANSSQLTHVS